MWLWVVAILSAVLTVGFANGAVEASRSGREGASLAYVLATVGCGMGASVLLFGLISEL